VGKDFITWYMAATLLALGFGITSEGICS